MMNTTARATLAVLASVSLLAIPAMANAADTTVSFTIAASGTLAIGQAGGASTLTNSLDPTNPLDFSTSLPGTVAGSLPQTTVTDTRGTPLGAWTVSVVATGAFVNASNNTITVGANNARAYMNAADIAGLTTLLAGNLTGMVITGGEFTVGVKDLGTSYTLVSGTSTLGNGNIVYTPKVSVTVPAATPAGTYSTVVRQTVS